MAHASSPLVPAFFHLAGATDALCERNMAPGIRAQGPAATRVLTTYIPAMMASSLYKGSLPPLL